MEVAEDAEIDIPLIHNYLAKMISPLLPNYISLKQVIEIGKKNVILNKKGHKLICEILASVKDTKVCYYNYTYRFMLSTL